MKNLSNIIAVVLLLTTSSNLFAEDKKLTIYTYDSFAAEWGPGPAIKDAFEQSCNCTIEFVATSNAATLLTKIKLEGSQSKADIVLGFDQNFILEAEKTNLFVKHLIEPVLNIDWDNDYFTPYDYGQFAFVYDESRLLDPPQSMTELVSRDDIKIIVQDPRTSTPGLGLLLWIKSIYGDNSQAVWKNLDSKIVTYTPGWSEAYGMFLENEADMVLSYTTSPAYHLMYENTSKYKAASFKEGHYMQIEVAGILKSSQNFNLAQKFMKFISTEEFQSQIPTKNIMYPVTNIVVPDAFNQLNQINKKLLMKPELVHRSKKAWINEWLNSQ